MYRTVVTICTAIGHYMYCHWSLRTVQWSLSVPHSGNYMYRQFNITQFHVLPTQSIYVFCVDLRTAIIFLYSINWLVCITETECVYCAVQAGSLYAKEMTFRP